MIGGIESFTPPVIVPLFAQLANKTDKMIRIKTLMK
jgi:hypothetical protein